MLMPTEATASPRRLRGDYGSPSLQGQLDSVVPVFKVLAASTTLQQVRDRVVTMSLGDAPPPEYYVPASAVVSTAAVSADAAVIQVWEGTVLSVDRTSQSMVAKLHAKLGVIPDHTGEIDFEWVADQDADLISPGAVFYLTLYKKRKKGGTVENSQELRFRRRPSWSRRQVSSLDAVAERLLSKLKASAVSDD